MDEAVFKAQAEVTALEAMTAESWRKDKCEKANGWQALLDWI